MKAIAEMKLDTEQRMKLEKLYRILLKVRELNSWLDSGQHILHITQN